MREAAVMKLPSSTATDMPHGGKGMREAAVMKVPSSTATDMPHGGKGMREAAVMKLSSSTATDTCRGGRTNSTAVPPPRSHCPSRLRLAKPSSPPEIRFLTMLDGGSAVGLFTRSPCGTPAKVRRTL